MLKYLLLMSLLVMVTVPNVAAEIDPFTPSIDELDEKIRKMISVYEEFGNWVVKQISTINSKIDLLSVELEDTREGVAKNDEWAREQIIQNRNDIADLKAQLSP